MNIGNKRRITYNLFNYVDNKYNIYMRYSCSLRNTKMKGVTSSSLKALL